jgi:hypothetical protein
VLRERPRMTRALMAEGLKVAAQSFDRDVTKLSCSS